MRFLKRPDAELLQALEAHLGRRPQALAHASGEDAVLVACREELCERIGDRWQVWPWEQVGGGGWSSETGVFSWRTTDGEAHEVTLDNANRFPDVFKERVEASLVVYTVLEVPRGRVQIIARRSLGPDSELHWYAVPAGQADLADPATAAAVVAETDRLKQVYL